MKTERQIPSDIATKAVALGTFKVESGKLIVSDPCYEVGTWCQSGVDKARNGTWHAFVKLTNEGEWGVRVAALYAVNALYATGTPLAHEGDRPRLHALEQLDWELAPGEIGVDSGQAGIFDAEHYRKDEDVKDYTFLETDEDKRICTEEVWYSMNCDATLKDDRGGRVIPFGVVSRSGYGDGGYSLTTVTEKGKVVAARITFIGDEDEDADD